MSIPSRNRYSLSGLERNTRLTAGKAWWIIIIVVVAVVSACTAQAVIFCNNCQSSADSALAAALAADPDSGAFICNYNCSTSACGVGSDNCQYNICRPKTSDELEAEGGQVGDGGDIGGPN